MALRPLFDLHITVGGLRQDGSVDRVRRIAHRITRAIKQYVRWAERDGDFEKKCDYISPVFIITHETSQAATSTGRPIVEQCQKLVEKYRSGYATRGIQDYPRCIYIFVVVQHVVLIMVADTKRSDGEPYPLAELDLSQRSHWLDYSLAISITVLMAKEALMAHRSSFPKVEWETDDPDA